MTDDLRTDDVHSAELLWAGVEGQASAVASGGTTAAALTDAALSRLERVDPRPAGLFRIAFGIVVLWTLLDLIPLVRFLFTDEGLWLPDMARKHYGGELRRVWDPEHGWEHWWSVFPALWGKFSLFHLRADPPFVWAVFGLTCAAVTAPGSMRARPAAPEFHSMSVLTPCGHTAWTRIPLSP